MSNKPSLSSIIKGFGVTCSLVLVFFFMNQLSIQKQRSQKKSFSQFVVKSVKSSKKNIVKKKKPKKRKVVKRLKPNLKNSLRGKSFGIPSLEVAFDSFGDDQMNIKDGVFDSREVDKKAKIVYRPQLEYPSEAIEKSISGYVTLSLLIDDKGKLERSEIIESFPEGLFDASAIENMERSRFKPAQYKGLSVATWQKQKISFAVE